MSSPSEPFLFAENIGNELKIAANIFNGKKVVWRDNTAGNISSWDTNGYMHKNWKIWLTLECWNHMDEKSFEIWLETALKFLSLLSATQEHKLNNDNTWKIYEMYKIAVSKTENIKLNKKFKNFETIKNWDLVYTDWKDNIYAEEDFTILLPNYNVNIKPWEEVFYYGKLK